MKFTQVKLLMSVILLSLVTWTLVSCGDDDPEPLPAAPSVSISSASTSNIPGATVGTTVTLNAPAGIKSLRILKNGATNAAYPDVTSFDGTTDTYAFTYVVEELAAGTVVNFTFQITDDIDRINISPAFAVTVSAVPPKPLVQVGGVTKLAEFDEHIAGVARDGVQGTFLQGNIEFTNDKIYVLFSYVRVGPLPAVGSTPQTDDGTTAGTLTIEPGTVIVGDLESKGTLVIQRGGKIFAEGTEDEPIVFTSERAPGTRVEGDWGGVVLCGRAPNNVAGGNVQLEGGYGAWHGGDNPNDNSGVLRYVRIEWAGIPINPNEEVNTLTMGSVGRGTEIEYVQAAWGLDDQYEWFGGTVDGRYLVAYHGLDDDFDVDLGHSGNIQFGIGIRDDKAADQSGSNGFEVDNNGGGALLEPFTSSVFSNITIIGPKQIRETSIANEFQHGAQLRRSSKLKIYNSFFTGYPYGIYIDGNSTTEFAEDDELQLRNVVIAGVNGWGGNGYGTAYNADVDGSRTGLPFLDGSGVARGNHPGAEPRGTDLRKNVTAFDIRAWFNTAAYGNQSLASWDQTGISPTLFQLGRPTFTIGNDGILSNGADWSNLPEKGRTKSEWFGSFEEVGFAGAFGTTGDWTEGWTNFDKNLDYGVNR